jgi:hypothetical protein
MLIDQLNIVMIFGPVVTDAYHRTSSPTTISSAEETPAI